MNAQQLQAMWARRREIDHDRCERVQAVNRYYDHWGKQTSRFQSWTAPQYYESAQKRMDEDQVQKQKHQKLEQRREALAKLFMAEKLKYDREEQTMHPPISRKIVASNELLEKIAQKQKKEEQLREKFKLEAKLYSKMRHGVDDEQIIFNSKSDNEVLAKLHWLDKKILEQEAHEKEEALAQERNLRIHQEKRNLEEQKKERQRIREQEIAELRALQERHMDELKQRQAECDELKAREDYLSNLQIELKQEQELLNEALQMLFRVMGEAGDYSSKKIKIHARNRSEIFRQLIKVSISILERMRRYVQDERKLQDLLVKYKDQLDAENYTMTQFEGMYESEVKIALTRCESAWHSQAKARCSELKAFIEREKERVEETLHSVVQHQSELVELRAAHLKAIENANEQMQTLFKEEHEFVRSLQENEGTESTAAVPKISSTVATPAIKATAVHQFKKQKAKPEKAAYNGSAYTAPEQNVAPKASESKLPKVTTSFQNLNLDVWDELPSARCDTDDLQNQRSLRVVTSDTAVRPMFGRKRIAWT